VRDRLDTQDACDAEVTELRFASCVEQDVARFDITMHQARSVNHCQSRCDSRSEGGLRRSARSNRGATIGLAGHLGVVDRDQMRVLQSGEHTRLQALPGNHNGVREVRENNFTATERPSNPSVAR